MDDRHPWAAGRRGTAAMTRTAATVLDPPGAWPDGDAQRLAVSIQRGDDRDTVHVRGQLDTVTVPLLEAVLEHLAGVAGRVVLVQASPAVARLLLLLAARPTGKATREGVVPAPG